jgi:hypothetical protein
MTCSVLTNIGLSTDASDSSDSDSPYSMTQGTTSGKESKESISNEATKNRILKDETTAVSGLKLLVLIAMPLAAIADCLGVHTIT